MPFDVHRKQDATPWPILLARYFQMYWLKPFDAVNDAANAAALLQFDWSGGPILEIGGGDGVFSFIMHGGSFAFADDRYDQADPGKGGDIYNVYDKGQQLKVKKDTSIVYDLGVDLKMSHLYKARETGIYRNDHLLSSIPERLPIANNSFTTVFLYTFHGLTDYHKTLGEIRRVIRSDGTLIVIIVNDTVRNSFVCHKLSLCFAKIGWNLPARYFSNLDGGRFTEIGGLFAKSFNEWKTLFTESGFEIEENYHQVSPHLWKIYDTQTRPFLKLMIRCNRFLTRIHLKLPLKFLWMCLWLPVLMVSYLLMAVPNKLKAGKIPQGVFLAVKAKPV